MKNVCCNSHIKDPENRSKKFCACGGHSASDVKKNRKHHSTAKKLAIRKTRKESLKYPTAA